MNQRLSKILTVTGCGVEKVKTTLAKVGLGIEVRGENINEVQNEIANKSLALVELLRSRSVDQLKTTSIALRTYYESGDEKNLIKYVSTNKVSFSVSISDLGFLLDQTVKAGASRIDRVNFVATPEAILLAKQEALRKATIDAKTKAEVVLSTLGFTLEDVVRIEINGNPVSEIRTERRRRSSGGIASGDEDSSGIGISVIGGEQIVDASVTLQISY